MRRALAGVLIVALGLPVRATVQAPEREPASVSDPYQALVQSIQASGIDFRKAKTDSERRAAVEGLHVVALRYLEFAETHASDPNVLEAVLEAIRALNAEDRTWNLAGTPTIYLIDHAGVIRGKWVGAPGEKALDEALEKLILEAEKVAPSGPR